MGYRHLLIPTDGSARSRRAMAAALRLARPLGARVTVLYVLAQGVPTVFSGDKLFGSGVVGRRYRALAQREADTVLAQLAAQASAAGVPCRLVRHNAAQPWRAIVALAGSRGCDLIVMGSHGRGAAQAMLLGSQTVKVLAHSRIPVLVCR